MGTPESTFVVVSVITLILIVLVAGSAYLKHLSQVKGE